MKQVHRLINLPLSDQKLLMHAMFLLCRARVGLWIIPFRILRVLLIGTANKSFKPGNRGRLEVERIAWAITIAGRYVPGASCLVQAIAAYVLLKEEGHPANLHIGVLKDASGQPKAHAWVKSKDKVIVGGSGLELFTPLLALGKEVS